MLKSEDISVEKIKSGIGGYKKKATKEFVESIRAEYEAICKENLELKDKLGILSEGVQYYKNMEKSLQKALVLAERTTSETMHAAEVKAVAIEKEAQSRAETLKKEAKIQAEACEREATLKANTIIREAKTQADQAIAEGNEELRKIHSQIMTLVQQYEQYKTQYKQLALAQMNVLESEAYNLDAPILKTIQSAVESLDKESPSFKKGKDIMEHEVVEPVNPIEKPKDMSDFQKEEKKVYVDARGEVVEVHEFREITSPNAKGIIDPFQDPFDDALDDNYSNVEFFKGAYDTEKVVSFDEFDEDTSMSSSKTVSAYENSKVPEEGMTQNNNSTFQSLNRDDANKKTLTENINFSTFNTELADSSGNLSGQMEELSFEKMSTNPLSSDVSYDVSRGTQEVCKVSTTFEEPHRVSATFEEPHRVSTTFEETHKVSGKDMKKIEQMQLERLRQEEEQQTELLKKSQLGKFTNPVSTASVPKDSVKEKVSDDFFKVLHNEDEKHQEVSLHDLHAKQDEDNQKVPLPKASEGQNMYFSNQPNKTTVSVESVNKSDHMQDEQINIHKYTEEEMKTVRNNDFNANSSDIQNTEFLNDGMNEQKSFFEQFSTDTDSKDFKNFKMDEDINSLEQEMDKPENLFSNQNEQPDFLSFRDFKSGM